MAGRRPPPRSLAELAVRAEALAGRTLGELAVALGVELAGAPERTKGRVGELVERALGASPDAGPRPDFPELGVELKTVPVDAAGVPRESTFVCAIRLDTADRARWQDAPVRRKLAHVLWVPVLVGEDPAARRIGEPRFVRMTAAQEEVLRADFDELMGLIGAGGVDELTARRGRWLQVRPKAANAAARTLVAGATEDGALVETGPRGFYLRRRFVAALLVDAAAVPE